MTDHDAIAARVRQDRETGTPGPWKEFIDDSGDQWTGWPLSIDCTSITDKTIVRTGGQWPYEWDAKTSRIEACANARRIAALPDLEAAYLDLYDEVRRLRAERDRLRTQCCMCGKTGLSTIEDGGPECELDDGRWVCSVDCYDLAVLNHLVAEAERDRLRAALNEIATAASGIAHGLQIGPDDEGRDIHEMALAIRDDARAALKGDSDE